MADSNTTTYSFTLPEVGASADSWGTKLNANWDKVDDLLDGSIAVNGITVTGGSIDGTPVGATTPSTGEFTTVTTTGNVGIGTASPSAKLTSLGFSGTTLIQALGADSNGFSDVEIKSTGTTGSSRLFFSDTAGQSGFIKYAHSDNSLQFGTNDTERARLDSSGNLLVGKTSADYNTVGAEILPSGRVFGIASGLSPFYANRKSSDGALIDFGKDGAAVGSIGALTSQVYIGSGDTTGLIFHKSPAFIGPKDASNPVALDDANISLGWTNQRFKDLYLSGGVYLGGTGAANKLDDYEEGTFTPTYLGSVSNPTITYNANGTLGRYTKVGNLVHIKLALTTDSATGGSGNLRIGGLPFAPSTDGYYLMTKGFTADNIEFLNPPHSFLLIEQSGFNAIELLDSSNDNITVADLKTGGNSNRLRISCTYRVNP